MIQRIQSLYLLSVTVLTAIMLFAPLAWFVSEAGSYELHAFRILSAEGATLHTTPYLGIVLTLACLLPLLTLLLFRRRMLQIRLCAVEAVLLIGVLVMEGAYYYLSNRVFADLAFRSQGIKPTLFLPVIALIAVVLAARAIFRDEVLVRSADRIR